MKRFVGILALLTLLVLGLGLWWSQRPHRTTEAFVGHMSKGRYAEAEAMVAAPSSLQHLSDGALLLGDQEGSENTVAPGLLPFLVYGDERTEADRSFGDVLSGSREFSMMASGTVVYLRADGGNIVIDRVDAPASGGTLK